MTAPGPGHIASPKGAGVYFHDPIYGIRVPQRFTVQIGLPPPPYSLRRQQDRSNSADSFSSTLFTPGNGQSEVVLTLKPGAHMLQLLMGDHVHTPDVPPAMSKKMILHVR